MVISPQSGFVLKYPGYATTFTCLLEEDDQQDAHQRKQRSRGFSLQDLADPESFRETSDEHV